MQRHKVFRSVDMPQFFLLVLKRMALDVYYELRELSGDTLTFEDTVQELSKTFDRGLPLALEYWKALVNAKQENTEGHRYFCSPHKRFS